MEKLPENKTVGRSRMVIVKAEVEQVEKIVDMYQKGLLTEDEFAAMKKKIIEQ